MAEPTSCNGAELVEGSSGKEDLVPINYHSSESSNDDAKRPSNASIYQVFSLSQDHSQNPTLIVTLADFPNCDSTGKNSISNRHFMLYWVRNYIAFDDAHLREFRDHLHGILNWDD